MFTENYQQDGRLAVWLPCPPGLQGALISDAPATYFNPPYVGSSGWIGIVLEEISDESLQIHIQEAWALASRNTKKSRKKVVR